MLTRLKSRDDCFLFLMDQTSRPCQPRRGVKISPSRGPPQKCCMPANTTP